MGEYIVHVIYRSAAKSYTIECYDKADAYNKAAKEKVRKYLQAEVEGYDQYLTGDVYGFILEGGGQDDSCWGFYGSNFIENGLLDTAFASKRTRNRIARMIGGETARSVK